MYLLVFHILHSLVKDKLKSDPLLHSFAHTKEHAVDMAEKVGYRLEHYEDIVPRMEKGEPVKGHLFGFVLSSSNEGGTSQEL